MAARDIARHYPAIQGKLRVVENGIQLDAYRPNREARLEKRRMSGISARGRVVMFVGNDLRRKGLDVAWAAFRKAASPEDQFWVLSAEKTPAIVDPRFRAWGAVRGVHDWLPAADTVILPTLYDSAANSTLEAMACGVPPVTSARDGNAERIPDSRLVVTDPRDVQAFAEALDYALQTQHLREQVRAAAEAWPVSRNGEAMERWMQEVAHGG